MACCPQCSRTLSVWRRDVLTGLCPKCLAGPHPVASARLARRCRTISLVVVLTLLVTGLAVVAFYLCYCTPFLAVAKYDAEFSSEKWRTGDPRTRGTMAKSLASSTQLHGKSEKEILALLGKPDKYDGFLHYRVDIGYRWIFQPYLYDLWVRLDKDGKFWDIIIRPPRDEWQAEWHREVAGP
jgi:hypothetical protein